jgi:AraC family transcriptional regulator
LRGDLVPKVAYGADFPNLSVYECHPYRAVDMFAPPREHHVISVYLDDAGHLRQERAGVVESGVARRGEAILKPAGYESRWHGEVPWHVRIALPADALLDVAYARGLADRVRVDLRNEFRLPDRFIGDLALLFRVELRRAAHPAQTLIADGLALALTGHLLGHYSSLRDPPAERVPSGTRPAVRRALEYLHANPAARHSLEDLASAAGLSKHHFARAFRAQVGMPPGSYVERLRIDQAKRLLRTDPDATVAEIAHGLGFADHSHFTRRFRKWVGQSPSSFRNRTE